MSFHRWHAYVKEGRNGYDRPVRGSKNVRICARSDDAVAIKLHNTYIITFHRDGRTTLATNGWTTVTTLRKIREFSPARIDTNGGDWQIPFDFDPKDLPPQASTERTIMRPFTVADPGREPVDDGVGCRVGEQEEYEYQDIKVRYHSGEHGEHGYPTKLDIKYEDGSGGVRQVCVRTGVERTEIAPGTEYGRVAWQSEREIRERGFTPKPCPHCVTFAKLHAAWDVAMNGAPYGRAERTNRGYRQMCEQLDTYGSREAWFDAYIAEFRDVRANRIVLKEWQERNTCPFHDGIEITGDGYVPLKFKREILKQKRRAQREQRRYERQECERRQQRERHLRMREQQREVKREIALALAGNINLELEAGRTGWHEMKARHHAT